MDPTLTYSSDIAFTPSVKAVQSRKGSRRAYGCPLAAWLVPSRAARLFFSCPSVTDIYRGANEQRNTQYQRRQCIPEQIAHERRFTFPSTKRNLSITGLFQPTRRCVRYGLASCEG